MVYTTFLDRDKTTSFPKRDVETPVSSVIPSSPSNLDRADCITEQEPFWNVILKWIYSTLKIGCQ